MPGRGSDASAAGGGESELSEWQRSTDAKALRRRRQMSGTATEPMVAPTDSNEHCLSNSNLPYTETVKF